jgi:hypothetical protein
MARISRVRRPTVERRLRRIGRICKEFHESTLHKAKLGGGIKGIFQMDELETYEGDRRLSPVTFPVLIERKSYFVVHGEAAPMAARGNLTAQYRARLDGRNARDGVRRSGSRNAVQNTFRKLMDVHNPHRGVHLQTDMKKTYGNDLRDVAGEHPIWHTVTSSKIRRNYRNLLFPINHTFAMMRDCISRLVRRTWAASKRRQMLDVHFWVWVAYRNYVRGITVQTKTTPAQALGVIGKALKNSELLKWRWPRLGC